MDKKLRICTICARGGSKGVKKKNLRNLNGKPLLGYSIEQARLSGQFVGIGVSSDSDEILELAKELGADWQIVRPPDLAEDTSPKLPAIQHCAGEIERILGEEYNTIVDLDASAPLRSVDDVVAVVRLLESSAAANVITGVKARRSPYFNLVELNKNGTVELSKPLTKQVIRRQESPLCFDMNASIYAWTRSGLINSNSIFQESTLLYEMNEETAFDIDSEEDFELVQWIMRRRGGKQS